MNHGISYASSPLLASKTPVWRSKFIVAAIAIGFAALAGRAVYIQVINNQFFKKQGELRFVRTLDLPANRGQILDRNGLILASSVMSPSVWAIPEDVEITDADLTKLAKLLEIPVSEVSKKLNDEDKSFVWLKRQVDAANAKKIEALGIKGVYFRNEYKRKYP
ncbi:MAG: penicillin-binding protein 2, partial [Burkholderiaceae bacterium]